MKDEMKSFHKWQVEGWELERKYSFLFEEAQPLSISFNMNRKIIDANELALKTLGFEREELLGKDLLELIVPQQREKAARGFALDLQGKENPTVELGFMTPEGIHSLLFAQNAVILFEKSKPVGACLNAFDTTDLNKAALKWHEEYTRFISIFETIPQHVFVINPDYTISFMNKNAMETLGNLVGKICYQQAGWNKPCSACPMKRVLKRERPLNYELEAFGQTFHGTAAPIKTLDGSAAILTILHDITQHKKEEEQLELSFIDLAETTSRTLESRDPYTAEHQHRVARLTQSIGKKMKLDKNRLMGLYIGALLHDIGKTFIPTVILSKPGGLNAEEWGLIRAHTKQGYKILKDTRFPWPVADMALHHHERLDGSGYPHGINGDELSLEVRILGICDVVEAMSSHRPYRPAKKKQEIVKEIKSGSGIKYDASVADIMLGIIEKKEFALEGT